MADLITEIIVAAALPPLSSVFWAMLLCRLEVYPLQWGAVRAGWAGASVAGVVYAFGHDWGWVAGSAVSLAACLAAWWWRGRRDRVRALIGAKSRALRDALVARMPGPRPVLRPVPVPGGTGG